MKKNTSLELRNLIVAALLAALDILCLRVLPLYFYLPPGTTLVRASTSILWFGIAAWLLGPGWAAGAAMTSDLLGAMINATGSGAFFPGYTLSAGATGLILGLLLYRQKPVWWRSITAVSLQTLLVSIPLSALWGSMRTGANWWILVQTTAPWRLVLILPYAIALLGLQKALEKPIGNRF